MSSSYYRGKVHTDADIKGPFTEAEDDITLGLKILKEHADALGTADVVVNERSDGLTEVMFLLEGVWFCIRDDGLIEIGEGGA